VIRVLRGNENVAAGETAVRIVSLSHRSAQLFDRKPRPGISIARGIEDEDPVPQGLVQWAAYSQCVPSGVFSGTGCMMGLAANEASVARA
jgi:hypothetical protein